MERKSRKFYRLKSRNSLRRKRLRDKLPNTSNRNSNSNTGSLAPTISIRRVSNCPRTARFRVTVVRCWMAINDNNFAISYKLINIHIENLAILSIETVAQWLPYLRTMSILTSKFIRCYLLVKNKNINTT